MSQVMEKIETREWLHFESHGQQLFGILHRPTSIKNPPLVVCFHGFASNKLGTARSYVSLAETLSKGGIATLRFDFRGSGDSEGELSQLSLNDFLEDARVVLNELPHLEGIDSQRVGFFGASLGGAIATLVAAHYQQLKALVLWAPVASGELWYRDFIKEHPLAASKDPAAALSSYRGISVHPLFKKQFGEMNAPSALSSLTQLPLLHMQSSFDKTTSLAHQEAFRRKASPESRFIAYPGEDHFLGYTPCKSEVIQESLNWFQKYF